MIAMRQTPPPVPGAAGTRSASPWMSPPSEFELRHRAALRASRADPVERVAALLVAIANNNSYEGRNPAVVPDGLTCGFVADLLGMSVATLANLLVELEHRGLVAPTSSGLALLDLGRLEALALGRTTAMAEAA
jgi:Crp-like helix-turn-helix domain